MKFCQVYSKKQLPLQHQTSFLSGKSLKKKLLDLLINGDLIAVYGGKNIAAIHLLKFAEHKDPEIALTAMRSCIHKQDTLGIFRKKNHVQHFILNLESWNKTNRFKTLKSIENNDGTWRLQLNTVIEWWKK